MVTPEQWHLEHLALHVQGVRKYLLRLLTALSELPSNIGVDRVIEACSSALANDHDGDKGANGVLFEPYTKIEWCYFQKQHGLPVSEYTPEMDAATLEHIKTNEHHPEFWDANYKPIQNTQFDKRDSLGNTVDCSKMPLSPLLEMCADWCSTADERGNTVFEWRDRVVGRKYLFNPEQASIINNALYLMAD